MIADLMVADVWLMSQRVSKGEMLRADELDWSVGSPLASPRHGRGEVWKLYNNACTPPRPGPYRHSPVLSSPAQSSQSMPFRPFPCYSILSTGVSTPSSRRSSLPAQRPQISQSFPNRSSHGKQNSQSRILGLQGPFQPQMPLRLRGASQRANRGPLLSERVFTAIQRWWGHPVSPAVEKKLHDDFGKKRLVVGEKASHRGVQLLGGWRSLGQSQVPG